MAGPLAFSEVVQRFVPLVTWAELLKIKPWRNDVAYGLQARP